MLIGLCVVVVVSAASADDLWRTRNVDKAAREANSGLIQMMRSNIATTTNNHVSVVDGSLNDATSERPTVEGVVVAEQCVNGTYAAVATNCSTFVACNGSNRTEGYCPPGMWFDPNHEADMLCNYPEVVCAADNTVCQCATEYPPLAADPLIEADVTCLKDNRFHLNGSRVDCGRYFVCFNGHVQRMECKQGFHYDPKAQRCDYPEIVNCKVGSQSITQTDLYGLRRF